MRRAARLWLISPLVLLLGACQTEDLGLPAGLHDTVQDITSTTEVAEAGANSEGAVPGGGTPGLSVVTVAAEALSAFFVESFAAYEDEAQRLRETDQRYLLQKHRWRPDTETGFVESYPLASARFEYAHAAGLTGAGQVVSIIDSGFLTSHEAFADTELTFPLGSVPSDSHGTGVASIIAGSSAEMLGVAPGASLSLASFDSLASLARATREAIRLGAVAQNNSWGYEIAATQGNYDRVFSADPSYIDALTDYARQGVVVFAASNDRTRSSAALMEALPAIRPELESGWLAVVSAVPEFDNSRIRSAELVSAGCLEAARWCLAADGAWIIAATRSDFDYRFATGTSFAAPQVSGALALLGEAFPNLTPHELRARLLASADNGFFEHDGYLEIAPGFFHGYNEEFGHGFLDMRAALLPIGPTIMPAESGGAAVAGEPILVAGAAVGDAVTRALSSHDVLVTDALGGDFSIGAEALVARALPRPLMEGRLARLGQATLGEPALRDDADILRALSGSRMSLTQPYGPLEIDVVAPLNASDAADIGVRVRHVEGGARGRLGFGVSVFRDGSGTIGMNALSDGGAASWAAALDIEAQARLSETADFALFGQVGLMGAPGGNDFARVSQSEFMSVGLDLGRRDAFRRGDRIGFGVALPTAITSGSADMSLPVARENGAVAFAPISVDLAPESREVRLSLSYATPLTGGWTLFAEGVHSRNRGHVSGATDTGALFGLQTRF